MGRMRSGSRWSCTTRSLLLLAVLHVYCYVDCRGGGKCSRHNNLCSALMAMSSEGSLTCHTYCDLGPRFLWSHPKDPGDDIYTSCRGFSSGTVTICFNDLDVADTCRYEIHTSSLSWEKAVQACKQRGLTLASLSDKNEASSIYSSLQRAESIDNKQIKDEPYWVGLRMDCSQGETSLYWGDCVHDPSATVQFSDISDFSGCSSCGFISQESVQMSTCSSSLGFICENPAGNDECFTTMSSMVRPLGYTSGISLSPSMCTSSCLQDSSCAGVFLDSGTSCTLLTYTSGLKSSLRDTNLQSSYYYHKRLLYYGGYSDLSEGLSVEELCKLAIADTSPIVTSPIGDSPTSEFISPTQSSDLSGRTTTQDRTTDSATTQDPTSDTTTQDTTSDTTTTQDTTSDTTTTQDTTSDSTTTQDPTSDSTTTQDTTSDTTTTQDQTTDSTTTQDPTSDTTTQDTTSDTTTTQVTTADSTTTQVTTSDSTTTQDTTTDTTTQDITSGSTTTQITTSDSTTTQDTTSDSTTTQDTTSDTTTQVTTSGTTTQVTTSDSTTTQDITSDSTTTQDTTSDTTTQVTTSGSTTTQDITSDSTTTQDTTSDTTTTQDTTSDTTTTQDPTSDTRTQDTTTDSTTTQDTTSDTTTTQDTTSDTLTTQVTTSDTLTPQDITSDSTTTTTEGSGSDTMNGTTSSNLITDTTRNEKSSTITTVQTTAENRSDTETEVTSTDIETTTRAETMSTEEKYNSSFCTCTCKESNMTLQEKIAKIVSNLKVNKSALSSSLRRKTSMEDIRASSAILGTVGVVIICFWACVVLGFDLLSYLQYKNKKRKGKQVKAKLRSA